MMGKINVSKANEIEPARTHRTGEDAKIERRAEREPVKSAVFASDRLEFSSRANEVGKAVNRIKELPDTRAHVVQELRERIRSGDYRPSGTEIADAIMRDES